MASLNEQRVHEGKIVGTPDGYSEVMFPDWSRAAFWVNSRLKYCVITNTRDIVVIRRTISGEDVLIVSYYCSPSEDIHPILTQLGDLLDEYPRDNIQVVGDYNAKSFIWGERPTDPRGEEVISFALKHDLEIINKPDSLATFGHQGQSWIDLLLIRNCAHRITDWTIEDWVTLSDHNAMTWTYQGRPGAQYPRGVRRRWKPRDLVWDDFLRDL